MKVGTWLKKQFSAPSDFTTKSVKSDKIQKDLDELAGRVDELKQPVEVSLEGSYDDLSSKRKLMLGAAGGAAAGGVLGAAHGLLSPIGDQIELQVDWQTNPIMEQSLRITPQRSQINGLSSQVTSEGVIDVSVKGGVRYDFQSEIVEKEVGTYQVPGDVTVSRSNSSNVLKSGLIGAGLGAGAGLLATGAYIALKSVREEAQEGQPPKPADESLVNKAELKTLAGLGGIGAVGGAGIGALSGWMETNRAAGLTEELKWETPVMETTDIGEVPESASIMIRRDVDFGEALNGSKIYRDPTEFDLDRHMERNIAETVQGQKPERGLLGGIKMETQSKTYQAEATTTILSSALGGALVGGVVGVATGVCYNTLKRMIEA